MFEATDQEPWLAVSRWWLADAGITPNNLRSLVEARLATGISKECAVFGAIFDFHAALHPGSIVGEKTPDHVNHVAHIRKCFSKRENHNDHPGSEGGCFIV